MGGARVESWQGVGSEWVGPGLRVGRKCAGSGQEDGERSELGPSKDFLVGGPAH